jgi:hypothetical protein
MSKRPTPPQLLRSKQPVVVALRKELKISRWHAYGLLNPEGYPDAIPAALFDTRSDLASRIATVAGVPVEVIRDYYAKAKAAAA